MNGPLTACILFELAQTTAKIGIGEGEFGLGWYLRQILGGFFVAAIPAIDYFFPAMSSYETESL